MARQKLDADTRKVLVNARKMIDAVAKADGNEAETRRRIERIFESVMRYDALNHISREYAVHGVGNTEHCDFAIQLGGKESTGPVLLVEIKRVNIDLAPKHIKQIASYAIDLGCDWALLTNAREWKLYHILFGKPPETKLVESWNLLTDDLAELASKFDLIGYKNVKKGGLARLWEKTNVLTPQNLLKAILSEDSLSLMGRKLKKATGVTVSADEVVGAVRHLLNESALTEMERIRISLPKKKAAKPRTGTTPTSQKKDSTTETMEELLSDVPSLDNVASEPGE